MRRAIPEQKIQRMRVYLALCVSLYIAHFLTVIIWKSVINIHVKNILSFMRLQPHTNYAVDGQIRNSLDDSQVTLETLTTNPNMHTLIA